MIFTRAEPNELERSKKEYSYTKIIKKELTSFSCYAESNVLYKVEDNYYNNNNDLRRAIRYVICETELPLKVLMKCGKVFIIRR